MNQNRIAITGTIASGKSVVSSYLAGWDYLVIDADAIARGLVEPGSETLKAIDGAFDETILAPGGALDRARLAEIIFHDEEKRKRLNAIMHPEIAKVMLNIIEDRPGVVFFEIPLLFENRDALASYGLTFSEAWLVDADPEVRLKRLMARDGIDEAYAQQKIDAQMSAEEQRQLADRVFDNSGDLMALYRQVDEALEVLRGEAD